MKGYPTAIQAVLKGRTVAIRKGNKQQLNYLVYSSRRQELPLSGGNGNLTSGYEANERCAADHATRPAAHRIDHTCNVEPGPSALRWLLGDDDRRLQATILVRMGPGSRLITCAHVDLCSSR